MSIRNKAPSIQENKIHTSTNMENVMGFAENTLRPNSHNNGSPTSRISELPSALTKSQASQVKQKFSRNVHKIKHMQYLTKQKFLNKLQKSKGSNAHHHEGGATEDLDRLSSLSDETNINKNIKNTRKVTKQDKQYREDVEYYLQFDGMVNYLGKIDFLEMYQERQMTPEHRMDKQMYSEKLAFKTMKSGGGSNQSSQQSQNSSQMKFYYRRNSCHCQRCGKMNPYQDRIHKTLVFKDQILNIKQQMKNEINLHLGRQKKIEEKTEKDSRVLLQSKSSLRRGQKKQKTMFLKAVSNHFLKPTMHRIQQQHQHDDSFSSMKQSKTHTEYSKNEKVQSPEPNNGSGKSSLFQSYKRQACSFKNNNSQKNVNFQEKNTSESTSKHYIQSPMSPPKKKREDFMIKKPFFPNTPQNNSKIQRTDLSLKMNKSNSHFSSGQKDYKTFGESIQDLENKSDDDSKSDQSPLSNASKISEEIVVSCTKKVSNVELQFEIDKQKEQKQRNQELQKITLEQMKNKEEKLKTFLQNNTNKEQKNQIIGLRKGRQSVFHNKIQFQGLGRRNSFDNTQEKKQNTSSQYIQEIEPQLEELLKMFKIEENYKQSLKIMQSRPDRDQKQILTLKKDFEERKKFKHRSIDKFRKTTNMMILGNRLKHDQQFYEKYYWILNQIEKEKYERINPESVSPVKRPEYKQFITRKPAKETKAKFQKATQKARNFMGYFQMFSQSSGNLNALTQTKGILQSKQRESSPYIFGNLSSQQKSEYMREQSKPRSQSKNPTQTIFFNQEQRVLSPKEAKNDQEIGQEMFISPDLNKQKQKRVQKRQLQPKQSVFNINPQKLNFTEQVRAQTSGDILQDAINNTHDEFYVTENTVLDIKEPQTHRNLHEKRKKKSLMTLKQMQKKFVFQENNQLVKKESLSKSKKHQKSLPKLGYDPYLSQPNSARTGPMTPTSNYKLSSDTKLLGQKRFEFPQKTQNSFTNSNLQDTQTKFSSRDNISTSHKTQSNKINIQNQSPNQFHRYIQNSFNGKQKVRKLSENTAYINNTNSSNTELYSNYYDK